MRPLALLRNKIPLGALAVLVALLAALLWRQHGLEREWMAEHQRAHVTVAAAMLAAALRPSMAAGDAAAAERLARDLVDGRWLAFVHIESEAVDIAVGRRPPADGEPPSLLAESLIRDGAEVLGRVEVVLRPVGEQERRWLGIDLLGSVLLLIALAVVAASSLVGLLFRDLHRLKEGARRIAAGEYGHQLPVEGNDALAQAVAAFNAMSHSLHQAHRLDSERERALRLSEMRLAEAQRIASLGHWEWNYLTQRVHWSDEIYRLLGLVPGAGGAGYELFLAFVHPDERDAVQATVGQALDRQQGFSLEHRLLRRDGEERWVRQRGEVFRATDGAPLRLIGTVQDITDLRRADAALQQMSRRIISLLESTTDAYLAVDRHWRITYINAEAERLLEVARQQALGQALWDVAPELASSFYKRFHTALARQQREEFEGYYPPLDKWFETHLYPSDEGLWVFFRDVTARRHNEAALRENSARNQAVLENILDGIVTIDGNGLVTGFNRAAERIFGYDAAELLGRSVTLLMPEPYRSQHDAFVRRYLTAREDSQALGRTREMTGLRRDGSTFPLEIALSEATQHEQPLFIAVLRDLTERRVAEENMRLAAKVFDNSVEGILVTDAAGRIVRVNAAFSAITGYSETEILGQTPALLKSGRHDADFYQTLWARLRAEGRWQGEIWNRRKNGEVYPEWLSINVLSSAAGQPSYYVAIFSDITEKKDAEERIYHLAYYDALTELPNRTMFHGRLLQAMAEARRNRRLVALLYIDLDRFKQINETLGHFLGDELLKMAARRLHDSVRECDTVARLGGDEFVIMLTDLHNASEIAHIAQQVLAALGAPFQLQGQEVFITTSVGISVYPDDAETLEDMIKYADTAMYHAKESGRNNYQFYRSEMNAFALDRLVMENSLRRALEREEFALYFQPQNALSDGRIVGVEVLLRWNHPELGMVLPTQFIPVLEESGMIAQVDEWVLRSACQQLAAWQRAGLAPLRLAVNLSPRLFGHSGLLAMVGAALADSGADPAGLELEITEGSLMLDAEAGAAALQQLKALGIAISIDDFGTGYSSLSYLKRFPIDTLKIDQSFVRDVTTDADDAAIAGTIIAMGHSLNLKVLAEGVETAEQLQFLRRHGCDQVQGYLFSEPLPVAEIEQWLCEGRRLPLDAAAAAG